MKTPMPCLALGAVALGLCACEPSSGSGSDIPASASSSSAAGEIIPSGNPELLSAMRCWGYVRSSFYLHLAAPGRTGALPQATQMQMEAWNNRAVTLAHADDMSLRGYEALRDEVAISSNDLLDEQFRDAAIEPTQTCVDTTPEVTGNVPDLRQD
ncbi:MAG: hypothetical protein J0L52_03995 [Caulobacterales bacterium]|nr:hypothetical protein [Caulobacterales bacterium]